MNDNVDVSDTSGSWKKGILIVDDEPGILKGLKGYLEFKGMEVTTALGGQEGLKEFRSSSFSAVVCDLKMPGIDGLQFLRELGKELENTAVIIMSAFGTLDLVVESMQLGADDYISKPFTPEELLLRLHKVIEKRRLQEENKNLRSQIRKEFDFANIIGKSHNIVAIFERIKRLSDYNTNVLLQGESGTGKELFAKAIHANSSRKNRPFVAINCGAVPEHLLESELFGHKKGSFTDATKDKKGLFLEANLGTLFLDEIGEMLLKLQIKLLRAIQEREILPVGETKAIQIDIRIIAATLRDLEQDVLDGRFREDLYYRLNVISLHIPPLRERREDIPVLIEHFMKVQSKRLKIDPPQLSPEVMTVLLDYPWPGNVRELENCIEHFLVLGDKTILQKHLPQHVLRYSKNQDLLDLPLDDLSIKRQTLMLEKQLIIRALRKTSGNRTRAAKLLDISQRALLYKLKEYEIDIPPHKN